MKNRFNFHSLNIPGFQNIFINDRSLSKKLILALITIAFFGLSIFQIFERILYYTSEPIIISYEFQVEDKLRYPSISICPFDGFETEYVKEEMVKRNVSDIYQLLNTGLNLTDIWTLTGNNWPGYIVKCRYSLKNYCFKQSNWKRIYTLLGLCYTLEFHYLYRITLPVVSIFSAFNLIVLTEPYSYAGLVASVIIQLEFIWSFETRIFIHDISVDITYGVFERGMQMASKTSTFIYFNYRKISYQNITRRPCSDQTTYSNCILKCYDDEILRNKTCRLPFISAERTNLTLCSTSEDFKRGYPLPFQSSAATLFANVKDCKRMCKQPCVKHQYEYTIDSRNTYQAADGTRLVVAPLREGTHLFDERMAYRLGALFCDIGAILGLYLGISLLAIMQVLEAIYFMLASKGKHK